jgi:hypothetical protein
MSTLLMTVLLAVGAGDKPAVEKGAAAPARGGRWEIVYAEEAGRRQNAWERQQATLKGGTLSYEQDGKQRSLHLKFGPNQTVQATEGDKGEGTLSGVYIRGRGFFCLSLSKGGAGGAAKPEGATGGEAGGAGKGRGQSSGDFILILRRQRAAK